MKKNIVLFGLLVMSIVTCFSQVPEIFNYQAVLRNTTGELVKNDNVDVRVSIKDNNADGSDLYVETHTETTDDNGIINLVIGDGTYVSGDFATIDWQNNKKYLGIEIDFGNDYIDLGAVQLLSVPYALYANESDSSRVSSFTQESYFSDSSRVSSFTSYSYFTDSSTVASFAHNANIAEFSKESDSSRVSSFTQNAYFADSSAVAAFAHNATSAEFANNADLANNLSTGVYTTSTDTLFVVKDHDGNVVFAVFPDGAQVIVNETTKGSVGGFAVSGRSPSKSVDLDILRITPDSTRVYVNEETPVKGKVGGFAVSGRSPSKSTVSTFLDLTSDNYFIGHQTGSNLTTGLYNIMIGYESGLTNQTGSYNTFLGYQSGYLNNASFNSFLGYLAGRANTIGAFNTFMGYESGRSNVEGDYNVFLGHQTGYSNTNGHENVFIGYRSGYSNTAGYDNIFIGNLAGENASGNTHSTFIGNEAGKNITGDDNICIGDRSGTNDYAVTHETFGTVILGIDAGRNVVGENNTILGYAGGSSWGGESVGNNNTFVGAGAGAGGYLTRLGSDNVCLGNNAGFGKTGDDKLYIANNSTSTLIYGEFDNEVVRIDGELQVTGNVIANYGSPSDFNLKTNLVELKSGLSMIKTLAAYYFNWTEDAKNIYSFGDKKQIGLIAQDVEKVLPEIVFTSKSGYKAIDYTKLTPVLLNAVNEQQTQIEELKKENEELKQKLDEILKMLGK